MLFDLGVNNNVLESIGSDFKQSKLSTDLSNFNNSVTLFLASFEEMTNHDNFDWKDCLLDTFY